MMNLPMAVPVDLIATTTELSLAEKIRALGAPLGFQAMRFCAPDTRAHGEHLQQWLDAGYHGEMGWLTRNSDKRLRGDLLQPGTKTVIAVRMDYLPANHHSMAVLDSPELAYVARYALGRDYHKVLRKRLVQLAQQITELAGSHGYRPFVDSAPVMERQLAEQAGLGWTGKNTLLLAPGVGSWFFLGELFTDLDLPFDPPLEQGHCGSCNQCLVDCPTDAFVAPGVLDARKCISYLTIEYDGSIPVDLRAKMGNRIYGCDDCQLVCPHNNKADTTQEADFTPRHSLEKISLMEAFSWTEVEFLHNTEGSPIRRIGYAQWQRNIAVALGNAPASPELIATLERAKGRVSALVDEHIDWALVQLQSAVVAD